MASNSCTSIESQVPDSEVAKITKIKQSKIRFTEVNIRLYNRILGDNPAVTEGPPIQLSWEYTQQDPKSIDEYESKRVPRRPRRHLVLNSNTRRNQMHLHFEYSQDDIDKASEGVKKIQKQRQLSKLTTPSREKREELAQKVTRTIKRTFSREKIILYPWNESIDYAYNSPEMKPHIILKSH